MIRCIARFIMLAIVLVPLAAAADPIKLKLAFYSSDQTAFYTYAVKPFVDAVNENSRGGIKIEIYANGSLGRDQAQQAQLVRDGVADIAFVVLGSTGQFADHSVMELPGLFNDLRETTLVHTRMMASGSMEGYDDFFVIGAFATEPKIIHTRLPIATLDDLKGKRIRAIDSSEAEVLAKLGMSPVVLPIGKTPEAVGRGTVDGASAALLAFIDFGLGKMATYHYFLRLGPGAVTILMNRKTFESLPKASQDVIREYSGEWLAARFIEGFERRNKEFLERLQSDPSRHVIFPNQSETDVAKRVFKVIRDEWTEASPHNRHLLNVVEAELKQLRSAQ